jgi:hypothetical protein
LSRPRAKKIRSNPANREKDNSTCFESVELSVPPEHYKFEEFMLRITTICTSVLSLEVEVTAISDFGFLPGLGFGGITHSLEAD